ncbi:hypothetical protein AB7M45_007787 [Bradyrhizobium elkanii]|uniref:hypothetical protein n=1 Tax=Bradyrhizobium elkanii TaxID=29448 RepID=UPI0009117071|nr:hypothetical protein [Bradyrhizobium elkanii]MCW2195015.1 hypothetical protein [Bradyrhizobium elkanii]NWL67290.1 hypothetical protein [Bradyrhizobium elkanii]OIM94664.1 hypothetical protein BLN97_09335 [Bradyrhizobium elkanii]
MTFTCTGWAFIAVQLTCTMPDPAPAVVCPPVRAWSQDFQKQVAAEMRAVPNSALAAVAVQAIGDRDVARACARRKKAGKR